VTVDRTSEQHAAQLRIVWEGGAGTEHTVTLSRTGSHTRCTDQDTVTLVRQLAEQYPDKQIAAILARQGRRTGAGNQFTAHRVAGLRAHHKIPAAPVRANTHDGEMVTIAKAASELGVSTATVHRWLREGFITGEQITPGAPWQIPLTNELRQRVCQHAPDGWLPLAQAAEALGVARQTVLHKVQRGELAAVYVHNGKRKGLRIQAKPDQTGLFDNQIRQEAQC
jgi:biotin operon repressor